MEQGRTAYRLLLLAAIAILAGCAGPEQGTPATTAGQVQGTSEVVREMADTVPDALPQMNGLETTELSHVIIDAPNGTFGYEILSDGQLVIRQTSIPGMPGVEGARTKADAERLATLVIDKLRRGEMPPTVHEHELEVMGLLP